MSFSGFDLSRLEKAQDRAGHHLGCVLGIHDPTKIKNNGVICKKCGKIIKRKI